MAIISQDIFRCVFMHEKLEFYMVLRFLLNSPIDNKPALVQLKACCITGAKPVPEPMLSQLTDAELGVDELMDIVF